MLKLLTLIFVFNIYASELEIFNNCNFENIESIDSRVKRSSNEVKLILSPHLVSDEVIFDSWPTLCGSLLFELKQEPTEKIYKNWVDCLKGRKQINSKLSSSIQKCIKKILL